MGKAEATVFVRFKPELLILNPNFYHHGFYNDSSVHIVFLEGEELVVCAYP